MAEHTHGPWVDVHSHPGRCFLAGLGAVRDFKPGEARSDHDRQLAALGALAGEEGIWPVLAPADIASNPDSSPDSAETGVFLSCEGADFLDGDLGGLADAYRRGVRSITLVHYRVNELGDIQTEAAVHGGLTGFGRDVVGEMNRLGLIVDLAHATFAATAAALEESTAPIMISHSHLAHATFAAGGLIGAWPAGFAQDSIDDYCDEICRLTEAIGVAHVAIGTDLDANYRPVLTDYAQFPDVARRLAGRGMTPDEIDRILGGNFIDLFASVADQGEHP